jgi:hypothetical protein
MLPQLVSIKKKNLKSLKKGGPILKEVISFVIKTTEYYKIQQLPVDALPMCAPSQHYLRNYEKEITELCLRADSCWPQTAEAWYQSHISSCGICDGHIGTGTHFFQNASIFPYNRHSFSAPYSFINLSPM